jgi:hypothetical protein
VTYRAYKKLKALIARASARSVIVVRARAFFPGAVLCALALTFAARSYGRREPPIRVKADHLEVLALIGPARIPSTAEDQDRIEGEVVTIRPSGFDPREIARPQRPFTLIVENRSGLEEVILRLDREAGNRVNDARLPRQKIDWIQTVDLSPGRYVLSAANHPDWTCVITITAH